MLSRPHTPQWINPSAIRLRHMCGIWVDYTSAEAKKCARLDNYVDVEDEEME